MTCLYRIYVSVFRCLRAFNRRRAKPIEFRETQWLSIDATKDGITHDVTDTIRDTIRSGDLLTPDILERATRMDNVESWGYLTTALEYNKITAEGVVNGL